MSGNSVQNNSCEAAKVYWDKLHESYERENILCDDWLEQFDKLILDCETPVIDLGCGSGNDTKYLIEKGKAVIACDYSSRAIENMKKNFPELRGAECFDLRERFPFEDDFSSLIIADLSLHYFSEETTKAVLEEIKRVLRPEGVLLFRVNSVKDVNFGAGKGEEIERNYYRTADNRYKRFFEEDDIRHFFGGWKILYLSEGQLHRYAKPKLLWTGMCRAKK